MDELNIVSKFTKGIIGKILKRMIKRRFGYDISIQLNEFNITIIDGTVHAHLSMDTEVDKETFNKMLTNEVLRKD